MSSVQIIDDFNVSVRDFNGKWVRLTEDELADAREIIEEIKAGTLSKRQAGIRLRHAIRTPSPFICVRRWADKDLPEDGGETFVRSETTTHDTLEDATAEFRRVLGEAMSDPALFATLRACFVSKPRRKGALVHYRAGMLQNAITNRQEAGNELRDDLEEELQ